MWKEVDEKTKEKYNAMAKKEKERADKEIAAYNAKKDGEAAAVRAHIQPWLAQTRCDYFSTFTNCAPGPASSAVRSPCMCLWQALAGRHYGP